MLFVWRLRLQMMADLGYVTAIEALAHDEYGGCTGRKRAYLLCIHVERCGLELDEARQVLRAMCSTIRTLTLPATDFHEFLLAPDHPYLARQKKIMIDSQAPASH